MGNQGEVVAESITLGPSKSTSALVCQSSSEMERQRLFDVNKPCSSSHSGIAVVHRCESGVNWRSFRQPNDFQVMVF